MVQKKWCFEDLTFWIAADEKGIIHVGTKPLPDVPEGESALIDCAQGQMGEYFSGTRRAFDVPLHLQGTAFQRSVWQALQAIAYGQTRTYAQVAQAIGKEKAQRAVGGANNKNPVMIIVPCHRVIGANGALTGYAGGLALKERLLAHEKNALQAPRGCLK